MATSNEQLTSLQANETRFVTKIRWTIEDINGKCKQSFRALDGTIQNKMLPHIVDDLKIACALINCFHSRKISDVEDGIEIAREMKNRLTVKNDLEYLLNKKPKNRFEKIDESELIDFPKLSVEEIRKKITFGWYQINQTLGYLAEHFDKNGDIEIKIGKNNNGDFNIVASEFFSRHSNRTEYFVAVKYKPNDIIINSWICSCMSGKTCEKHMKEHVVAALMWHQ